MNFSLLLKEKPPRRAAATLRFFFPICSTLQVSLIHHASFFSQSLDGMVFLGARLIFLYCDLPKAGAANFYSSSSSSSSL